MIFLFLDEKVKKIYNIFIIRIDQGMVADPGAHKPDPIFKKKKKIRIRIRPT